MTIELKCPVCPYCDKLLHCIGTQYINKHIVAMWYCQNPECEETEDLIGTRKMWEIVAKVTQAKQDLEIATNALREICNDYQEDSTERAEKALETIGKHKVDDNE